MLLPIVLLLASANPVQQAKNVAHPTEQTAQAPSSTVQDSGSDPSGDIIMRAPNTGMIMRRHNRGMMPFDRGMIIPLHQSSNDACMSITAYLFSDGEDPRPKYVTNCPNLDVPLQNERAHRRDNGKAERPNLERTKQ